MATRRSAATIARSFADVVLGRAAQVASSQRKQIKRDGRRVYGVLVRVFRDTSYDRVQAFRQRRMPMRSSVR